MNNTVVGCSGACSSSSVSCIFVLVAVEILAL
jgi:hypothetical protein